MRVTRMDERDAMKRAAAKFGDEWLRPIAPAVATIAGVEELEVHSMERWIIARCIPRMEATAIEGLERNGFECWYPKGRFIKTVPSRNLPSKTRHKRARKEVVISERAAYPGYMLVRQIFGSFDINRLFDIPGVGGACCFGDKFAMLADHEVEVLRLQEARGAFDQFATGEAQRIYRYNLAKDFKAEAGKQYVGETTTIGRTCESGALVTFRKTLDRITRVIGAPHSEATP